jgi:predicted metal-dependent peptidase
LVNDKNGFLWKKNKRPNIKRELTGGTSFDAVAKHALKNKKKFDGYVILTDGGAPQPRATRGMKRCWVLAENCKLAFDHDKVDIVIKERIMLYNFNTETFKLVKENNQVKLYHKAQNKWSQGWTFIGKYKTTQLAENAAKLYTR